MGAFLCLRSIVAEANVSLRRVDRSEDFLGKAVIPRRMNLGCGPGVPHLANVLGQETFSVRLLAVSPIRLVSRLRPSPHLHQERLNPVMVRLLVNRSRH